MIVDLLKEAQEISHTQEELREKASVGSSLAKFQLAVLLTKEGRDLNEATKLLIDVSGDSNSPASLRSVSFLLQGDISASRGSYMHAETCYKEAMDLERMEASEAISSLYDEGKLQRQKYLDDADWMYKKDVLLAERLKTIPKAEAAKILEVINKSKKSLSAPSHPQSSSKKSKISTSAKTQKVNIR